VITLNMV